MASSKNILDVNEGNFDTEVVNSSTPVLLDFYADWCQPCQLLAPTIDKIADAYAGKVKIGKVDVMTSPGLASKFGISGIPALLIFKGGQLVQKFGFKKEAEIRKALDEVSAA